jgi:hypothetical protein
MRGRMLEVFSALDGVTVVDGEAYPLADIRVDWLDGSISQGLPHRLVEVTIP